MNKYSRCILSTVRMDNEWVDRHRVDLGKSKDGRVE